MAARLLRHNSLDAMLVTTWTAVIAAIPAARAYVGKVIVTNNTVNPVRFFLSISAAANSTGLFADITLGAGEVYSENVVITTGKQLNVYSTVANGVVVSAMGEEVDN